MPSTQAQSISNDLPSLPLGSTAKSFLDYLKVEAGLAENSILGYGRDLRGLLEFCESEGVSEISQLSPVVIRKYLKTLTQESKSESSMKRCVVAIRMFLRFAKLAGLIDNEPATWLTHVAADYPALGEYAERVQDAVGVFARFAA